MTRPDESSRNFSTLAVILSISFVVLSISAVFLAYKLRPDGDDNLRPDGGGAPVAPLGCLTANSEYITTDVAEIVTIDAEVVYDSCGIDLTPSVLGPQLSKDVKVGGRARLALVSPLFPGSIKPISQEIQTIDSFGDVGTWAWQVRADKPGDHRLSLVLSILGPDGDEVEIQNRREEVVLHVEKSFSYYAGVGWHGTTGFLTSLTGLVTAVVAAIVAVVSLRHQVGKRAAKS